MQYRQRGLNGDNQKVELTQAGQIFEHNAQEIERVSQCLAGMKSTENRIRGRYPLSVIRYPLSVIRYPEYIAHKKTAASLEADSGFIAC